MGGFQVKSLTLQVNERFGLFVKLWLPEQAPLKGFVQVAHGMRESTDYYSEFCEALALSGYGAVVNDARGHGRTAGDASSPEFGKNAGDAGADGINQMVGDLKLLTDFIKNQFPRKPVFLLGHSMGSVLARNYACQYGGEIDGLIYSGTTGPLSPERSALLLKTAREETDRRGRQGVAVDTPKLLFGHFNERFEPVRTGCEYMSRDEAMVDEALRSPYAGIPYRCGFYLDFLLALASTDQRANIEKIPKGLPVLSVSGDMDPFGDYGRGIRELFELYRKNGLLDTSCLLYEGGRHEMLREINRRDVFVDIVGWLDRHTGAAERKCIGILPPDGSIQKSQTEHIRQPDLPARDAENVKDFN